MPSSFFPKSTSDQPRCTPALGFCIVVEGLILIAVAASAFFTSSGLWRTLYRNIFSPAFSTPSLRKP
jgi:hypothetical protein